VSASRRGGTLKGVLILLLVMLLGVFTWATIANSRRVGELCIRPNDIDWWMLSTPAGAQEGVYTQSLLDEAKRLANLAEDKLWGPQGLVERCEAWWKGQQAKRLEAPGAASPDRQRCEQRFAEADSAFRSGLDAYKRAGPAVRASTGEKRAAVLDARTRFLHAHDLLAANLPPYEGLSDHDPARAQSAHQLLDYTQQLLDMTKEP
jgi:hypothetical protein